MRCTFAAPSLYSLKGLTTNYTCSHPLESITYPYFTSIHSKAEIIANFFLWLIWMKWTICVWFRITGFFGSPLERFSYCKSCNPGHDNIPNFTYFRAKGLSGFSAAFWYWDWHCRHVACGLMLQLRTVMKRRIGVLPSVNSITSMHVYLNRGWDAFLFNRVFFSYAFLYFILCH